jgi:hypothetical protein
MVVTSNFCVSISLRTLYYIGHLFTHMSNDVLLSLSSSRVSQFEPHKQESKFTCNCQFWSCLFSSHTRPKTNSHFDTHSKHIQDSRIMPIMAEKTENVTHVTIFANQFHSYRHNFEFHIFLLSVAQFSVRSSLLLRVSNLFFNFRSALSEL